MTASKLITVCSPNPKLNSYIILFNPAQSIVRHLNFITKHPIYQYISGILSIGFKKKSLCIILAEMAFEHKMGSFAAIGHI